MNVIYKQMNVVFCKNQNLNLASKEGERKRSFFGGERARLSISTELGVSG